MATGRPVPPPGGDWRRRMAVRGGRVSHTLAASGWLVFLLVGVGLGVLVGALIGLTDVPDPGDPGLGVRIVAGAFVGIIFCAVPSMLFVGLPAQYLARSYLRSATPEEQQAMREAAAPAPPPPPVPVSHGLRPGSRWARAYEGSVDSVAAFHDIVGTVPDGPAKDWLRDIGGRLDAELAEALRLARLGAHAEAGAPGGDTAREAGARLEVARTAFHDTAEHAASIALDLRSDGGLDDVRAQLDQLGRQAPQLRPGTT